MTHQALPPFAAWAGSRRPKALLVGEAWGRGEAEKQQPFVGESGKELWLMLGQAVQAEQGLWHQATEAFGPNEYDYDWIGWREEWLQTVGLAFTNLVAFRPRDNKFDSLCTTKGELPKGYSLPPIDRGKYLHPDYLPELDRLMIEILTAKPNLIVPLGNKACWAILQATNIGSIRGAVTTAQAAQIVGLKVLPTYHPASLLYEGQWSKRPIVVQDLTKAWRQAQFPEVRRPRRDIVINPTLEDFKLWVETVLATSPPLLSIDTETSFGLIDTISFSADSSHAIVVQVGPHRYRVGQHYETFWPEREGKRVASYWTAEEERIFWRLVKTLLESPIPKLFQNGLYDLQYLLRMSFKPRNLCEDTMLKAHAYWPEMPKSLGFLGSIYTDEPSWKLMRQHKGDSTKREE